MSAKRILGIDPGSRVTGFGVVDFERDTPTLVEAGVIRTGDGEFNDRLKVIYDEVGALVARFAPDCVAVEQVFVHKNAGSALKLGAARSAAICATFTTAPALAEYSPREIKQAVTGTGAATKDQVQHMMKIILRIPGKLPSDAADALAVAVCHGNSLLLESRLGALAGRRA